VNPGFLLELMQQRRQQRLQVGGRRDAQLLPGFGLAGGLGVLSESRGQDSEDYECAEE
jgi:hypothetical protein